MNRTIITTRLSGFLCPSDTPPSYSQMVGMPTGFAPPGNNYYASFGAGLEFSCGPCCTGGPMNGVVGDRCNVGFRDITDGLSNTVAFGEWKVGDGLPSMISSSDLIDVNSYPPGISRNKPQMQMAAGAGPFQNWLNTTCSPDLLNTALRKSTNALSYLGQAWIVGVPGISMGNVLLPPNARTPNCMTGTNGYNNPGIFDAKSNHPGGANFLMCDGSVRFLKDSINTMTLWSLGSRAQGEIIDASSY